MSAERSKEQAVEDYFDLDLLEDVFKAEWGRAHAEGGEGKRSRRGLIAVLLEMGALKVGAWPRVRMLNMEGACRVLSVARPTVERLIREGSLPSYKIGSRRLFLESELHEWMKTNRDRRDTRHEWVKLWAIHGRITLRCRCGLIQKNLALPDGSGLDVPRCPDAPQMS